MTEDKNPMRPDSLEPATLYQDLVETSQDLIWECDSDGRYVYLNSSWADIFGYTVKEMLGKKFTDFQNPDVAKRDVAEFKRLLKGNVVKGFESVHLARDGREIHLLFNAKTVSDKDGNIIGTRGTAQDVTAQRISTGLLKDRDTLYTVLFSESPMLMAMSRLSDNCIVEANRIFLETLGLSLEEVIGRTAEDVGVLSAPEDRLKMVEALKARGSIKGFELQLKKKDGTILPVLASSEIIDISGEKCILTSAIDISERKAAEARLTRSEFLMRTAIENLPIVFYMIDQDGIFRLSIGAGLKGLGLEQNQLVGESVGDVYRDFPTIIAAIDQALAGKQSSFEADIGGELYFSVCVPSTGWFNGITAVALNISERKHTEEALQKVQRLESLGILAGGIAHDFNNLLASIFGFIDLTLLSTQEPETRRYLSSVMNSMDRAIGLTRQLLTFSKGGAPIRKVIPVASFLRESVQFALSGSSVSGTFEIPDDVWPCHVDRTQIGQVIDNIVINAQQAMPAGGTLNVSAQNVTFRDSEHPPLSAGDYVQIAITDSGSGIPEEILSRIFDPFFTTKSSGHGLGLATSYSIMKRHGGTLEGASRVNSGSTFTLYLPASKNEDARQSVAPPVHLGSGTVIVADDEEAVLNMLGQMLEKLGYGVIPEKDCSHALATFSAPPHDIPPVAGIILDLTIPGGMGGLAAVREIRKLDSRIPIFATSGYSDDPVMVNPEAYGFNGSLCKPFTMAGLSGMLRTHLSPANDTNIG